MESLFNVVVYIINVVIYIINIVDYINNDVEYTFHQQNSNYPPPLLQLFSIAVGLHEN